MATLYIDEYTGVAGVPANTGASKVPGQAGQEPAAASQTVAINASSTQSSAFGSATVLVRLHTDAICSVAFGTNPTAVSSAKRLAANQTEYFGVRPGDKVAVIQNV